MFNKRLDLQEALRLIYKQVSKGWCKWRVIDGNNYDLYLSIKISVEDELLRHILYQVFTYGTDYNDIFSLNDSFESKEKCLEHIHKTWNKLDKILSK